MKKVFVAVIFAAIMGMLSGCSSESANGAIPSDATSLPEQAVNNQNLGVDYNAWFYCIDTSTSPINDQFSKMKRVIQKSLETDIKNNDVVWIIQVGAQTPSAVSFPMPSSAPRRGIRPVDPAQKRKAESDLTEALNPLIHMITTLKQNSGFTDLYDVIDRALSILKDQKAKKKFLVIGSDFVNDIGNQHVTAKPPVPQGGASAEGVNVALLLAFPKPEYLQQLRMSEAELENIVRHGWVEYFKSLNAANVGLQLVDSVPVSTAK